MTYNTSPAFTKQDEQAERGRSGQCSTRRWAPCDPCRQGGGQSRAWLQAPCDLLCLWPGEEAGIPRCLSDPAAWAPLPGHPGVGTQAQAGPAEAAARHLPPPPMPVLGWRPRPALPKAWQGQRSFLWLLGYGSVQGATEVPAWPLLAPSCPLPGTGLFRPQPTSRWQGLLVLSLSLWFFLIGSNYKGPQGGLREAESLPAPTAPHVRGKAQTFLEPQKAETGGRFPRNTGSAARPWLPPPSLRLLSQTLPLAGAGPVISSGRQQDSPHFHPPAEPLGSNAQPRSLLRAGAPRHSGAQRTVLA